MASVMKSAAEEQFIARTPSYFNQHEKCDAEFCFRKAHTVTYTVEEDHVVPVWKECRKHSRTDQTAILPFEPLQNQMIEEAIAVIMASGADFFNLDDVIETLKDIGYERQVNFATRKEVSALLAHVFTVMSFRKRYLGR